MGLVYLPRFIYLPSPLAEIILIAFPFSKITEMIRPLFELSIGAITCTEATNISSEL